MAARRYVTNKLGIAYRKASKNGRGRILDEVVTTTGMGRSTSRRMLTGPVLPDPAVREVPDRDAPTLAAAAARSGDLDKPFATAGTLAELVSMSAATIDRYLAPACRAMQLRGISTTTASPLLRNSIGLSKAGDAPPTVPGVIEAGTVAHCGPTFQGEFCRTLTMTAPM